MKTSSSQLILSAPVLYSIELTSICNNRCLGCGNVFDHQPAPQPLSAMQWRALFSDLKPYIHRLKLTGGEPTLHPEFEAIVTSLHELGIPFALFTNARWHDPIWLIDSLSAVPQCNGFLVSLHGATADSHEAFTRVSGSFVETCANICRATAAGLTVTTSTVITRHNWDEIQELVELSRALGADHAVFNRYLGRPLPQAEPSDYQLHEAIHTIDDLWRRRTRAKFGNCIPQCYHPTSSTGCLAGIAYCTVDPWGNVRPCNHAPLICGNLLKQPIEKIWHGEAMNRWRNMIAEQCLHCLELPRCHGGCRAVAMIQGMATDPLMRAPILLKKPEPPQELLLYKDARPVRCYTMLAEDFGHVLMRGNHIMPVSAAAKPILDACDGTVSLSQLQQQFGQEAVDFLGVLLQRGLVELQYPEGGLSTHSD